MNDPEWDVSSCDPRETQEEKYIRKLESEIKALTNSGVVECMVRNKQVSEYIGYLERQLEEAKAENDQVAKRCRWYSDRNQEHIATIASLRDGLRLILPMAKSYAERHPWGNNLSFIAEVDALLKEAE